MRIGVLADVHGNLPALDAALAVLRRRRVDTIACLGDLVGYGPFPNECVARVAELGGPVVAGNHDLMAMGRRAVRASPLARVTLHWTRATLDAGARAYLQALPEQVEPFPGLVLTHGALGDPDQYVRSSQEAAAQLRRLRAGLPHASLLLVGHTHRALAFGERSGTRLYMGHGSVALRSGESFLLNPGSVGQSRQWSGSARLLVLDLAARSAEFLAAAYDPAPVRAALEQAGLPPEAVHRRPPVWRAATGRLLRRRLAEATMPAR